MPKRDKIAGRVTLSEYLATLGLFLTLCISGMLTFVAVRLIETNFPGTPQLAYWLVGVAIFVAAYFAYGQIKLAPFITPVLFVVVVLLCREVASKPIPASHPQAGTGHQSR
ncbi:MAG TPA: hypothetical protein VKY85_16525 [Candidatus Angelobacter sp.]|nr:hypothetical protein [Candidatus Angelobacter sp.]